MARCGFSVINGLYKARLINNGGPKSTINSVQVLVRGNLTPTSVKKPAFAFPFLSNPLLCGEHKQEIAVPKHSTIYSGFDISLPSLKHFAINNKKLPSINFEKNNKSNYFQEGTLDIEERNIYWMGSLLKKRRRKMNRQKYKKRRKRDRFKREALKNLREKKHQRKERAAERKQAILSNMVVNKSISKRRARYLSHKLLPGVIKGQGLG